MLLYNDSGYVPMSMSMIPTGLHLCTKLMRQKKLWQKVCDDWRPLTLSSRHIMLTQKFKWKNVDSYDWPTSTAFSVRQVLFIIYLLVIQLVLLNGYWIQLVQIHRWLFLYYMNMLVWYLYYSEIFVLQLLLFSEVSYRTVLNN